MIIIIKSKRGKITFDKKENILLKNKYEKDKISVQKLAKFFKVSPQVISRQMKINNIQIRSDREQALKYSFNEYYFEKIDTEEKAYWLGFLYADGFIQAKRKHSTRKFGLSLGEKDAYHLETLKRCLNSNHKIHQYVVYSGYKIGVKYSRLLFTSEKTVNDLEKIGVFEKKTTILDFPTEEQVPSNLIHHFIRGYFDGDGCISRSGSSYYLSFCGTKEFLNGIQNFFNKDIKLYQRYPERGVNNYEARYGGNRQVEKFLNTLYKNSTIHLTRKHGLYLKAIEKNKESDIKLNNRA